MSDIIDVNPESAGPSGQPPGANAPDLKSETRLAHIMYLLHGLAPFTMLLLAVVAVIIGAVNRGDVRGTYLDSHYAWLQRTFWWGLFWWLIAWTAFWILTVATLGIGLLVTWIFPVAVFIWYLYRVIRGWLRLSDGLPV